MLVAFEIKRTDKGHWEGKVACPNCTRSSASLKRPTTHSSLAPEGVHVQVSLTRRLGQPVPTTRREHQLRGAAQIDLIADGNKNGFHASLGPHNLVDDFVVIFQGCHTTRLASGFLVSADQPGLGTAHGGEVKPQTKVAGEAETPRMGVTMAVEDHRIHGAAFAGSDQ